MTSNVTANTVPDPCASEAFENQLQQETIGFGQPRRPERGGSSDRLASADLCGLLSTFSRASQSLGLLSDLCGVNFLRSWRLSFALSAFKRCSRTPIPAPEQRDRLTEPWKVGCHWAYTIPFLNSSSGYFVPRQVTPSFRRVRNIERSKRVNEQDGAYWMKKEIVRADRRLERHARHRSETSIPARPRTAPVPTRGPATPQETAPDSGIAARTQRPRSATTGTTARRRNSWSDCRPRPSPLRPMNRNQIFAEDVALAEAGILDHLAQFHVVEHFHAQRLVRAHGFVCVRRTRLNAPTPM